MLARSGAARGDQRNAADGANRGQLRHVVAFAHAVLIHAVQHDLAGASILHLAHPVERAPVSVARASRVARVLIDVIVAVACQRVDANHDALRAEPPDELVDEVGSLERRGVHRNLVGAEVQHGFRVCDAADAAGHAERNVEHGCDAIDPRAIDGAPIRARRDVVEHELVGALVAIARGERHDVADDLVVAKLHALHDDAVADVEAWNYAPRKNGRISSGLSLPSSNALPDTVAATPVAASAVRSPTSRTPPEAWNSISAQRLTQSRYSSTLGPDSAPSRSMSVQSTCFNPAAAKRSRAASRLKVEARVQPCVAIIGVPSTPKRTSSAKVRRSGPNSLSHDATSSGSLTARLPMTARPATSRASSRLARARMPPPSWTSTPAAARMRRITGRLTGTPSLAPSRSTTCSDRAPSSRYCSASSMGSTE